MEMKRRKRHRDRGEVVINDAKLSLGEYQYLIGAEKEEKAGQSELHDATARYPLGQVRAEPRSNLASDFLPTGGSNQYLKYHYENCYSWLADNVHAVRKDLKRLCLGNVY